MILVFERGRNISHFVKDPLSKRICTSPKAEPECLPQYPGSCSQTFSVSFGFEDVRAFTIRISAFMYVTPCSLEDMY